MSAKNYNIRTAGQANIPVLGLGTWQSTGQDCVDVVKKALEMGYEHIDTAQAYGNEKEVGEGIKQSGVARDKFFFADHRETNLAHQRRAWKSTSGNVSLRTRHGEFPRRRGIFRALRTHPR